MLYYMCWVLTVLVLWCSPVIQGWEQQDINYAEYMVEPETCATKDSVGELQASVASLSTSMTSQLTQVNEQVQTRCDNKKVIKTIMSGIRTFMSASISELKEVLAEVATKADLQPIHSKQVEMALGQVATDDQLANSTMMLQMELQMMKDQVLAYKGDLKKTTETSTSIIQEELEMLKKELAKLKKTCQSCHTVNREEIGQTSSTGMPASDKIPLNDSNIFKHGGFMPGGAGPENLLHENGFWNPNPPPWFVIFDFQHHFTVESLELSNFGDVTHDVASFMLETTDNITNIDNYKLVTKVTNVQKGSNDPQVFTFSPATGRYWRFKVIKTHSEFQPWVEELLFHGHPAKEDEIVQPLSTVMPVLVKIPLNDSNVLEHGGFRPGGSGPENMLHENGFWNPNPPPWYVIFDFHRRYSVESLELSNFGDGTHDVASFMLETTDNITNIDNYKLVTKATNVQKGTNDPQLFTFSPVTGRYWRFKVIQTHSEFQPWIEELTFRGHLAKELSCPPQYHLMGAQCLLVFLGPEHDKTWVQAQNACQLQGGGDLAQLLDTTYILHHIITDLKRGDWKFWVRASWKNEEEGFLWLPSGNNVSNWEEGQPDNGGFKLFDHSDEHCVEIQSWNGKYNDQDCEEERSFICEIEPLETVVEKMINSTQSVIETNQLFELDSFHQEQQAQHHHLVQTGQEESDDDEHQVTDDDSFHQEQQAQHHHLVQTGQEESDDDEHQVTDDDIWRNCYDIHEVMLQGSDEPVSMSRNIFPFEEKDKSVLVFCDEETDGGGWTVIQHRGPWHEEYKTTRIEFNKFWHDYKDGFGDHMEDHWLGLDAISALTNQGPTELLIVLEDFNGEQRTAHYDHFIVHDHTTEFTMKVSGYSGDAGDSFSYHSGHKFTTIDVDNDRYGAGNCASEFGGSGWWHNSCHESNLNGQYLYGSHSSYADGIEWKAWHGYHYSLSNTTMMVRPRRSKQEIKILKADFQFSIL